MADRVGIMKDGKLEEVVEVKLPRPMHEDKQAFTAEVQKLRRFLEATHLTQSVHQT